MPKIRKSKHSLHKHYLDLMLSSGILLLLVFMIFNVIEIVRNSKNHLAVSDVTVNLYNPPGASPPLSLVQPQKRFPLGSQVIRVPILLYHYVEYNHDTRDTIRTSLAITPYWFEKQLKYLKDNGYESITFDDLYKGIYKQEKLPEKPIILTFDDGYRDFYTDAWPLLKKYNTKATVFVISGFLDKPNYLYASQLKEILADPSGLITLGDHTIHHSSLPSLNENAAFKEISESKKYLEFNFNQKITVFCYPNGQFNNQIENLVKKAGFDMGVSTLLGSDESPNNLYSLPRIRVGNYADKYFEERLSI